MNVNLQKANTKSVLTALKLYVPTVTKESTTKVPESNTKESNKISNTTMKNHQNSPSPTSPKNVTAPITPKKTLKPIFSVNYLTNTSLTRPKKAIYLSSFKNFMIMFIKASKSQKKNYKKHCSNMTNISNST